MLTDALKSQYLCPLELTLLVGISTDNAPASMRSSWFICDLTELNDSDLCAEILRDSHHHKT